MCCFFYTIMIKYEYYNGFNKRLVLTLILLREPTVGASSINIVLMLCIRIFVI